MNKEKQISFEAQEKEFLLKLMKFAAGEASWRAPHPKGTPIDVYIDDMMMIKELNPFRNYLMNTLEDGEKVNADYEPSAYFDRLLKDGLGKKILALWKDGKYDAAVVEYKKTVVPFLLPKQESANQNKLIGRSYESDHFIAKVLSKRQYLDDLSHDIKLLEHAQENDEDPDWAQFKTDAADLDDSLNVKEELIRFVSSEQVIYINEIDDPYEFPTINQVAKEEIQSLLEVDSILEDEGFAQWLKELLPEVVVKTTKYHGGVILDFGRRY